MCLNFAVQYVAVISMYSRPQFHLSLLGSLASLRTQRQVVAKVGTSKGGEKQWQTVPKNLPRMQCAKSHIGSITGLWFLPDRPLGLNTNEWMIQTSWFKFFHSSRGHTSLLRNTISHRGSAAEISASTVWMLPSLVFTAIISVAQFIFRHAPHVKITRVQIRRTRRFKVPRWLFCHQIHTQQRQELFTLWVLALSWWGNAWPFS